jgi:hypothetical protein
MIVSTIRTFKCDEILCKNVGQVQMPDPSFGDSYWDMNAVLPKGWTQHWGGHFSVRDVCPACSERLASYGNRHLKKPNKIQQRYV